MEYLFERGDELNVVQQHGKAVAVISWRCF